jgi:pimeloyl-ACP methyl ester carboxylesterase
VTSVYLAEHDCFVSCTVLPGDGHTHVYLPGLVSPAAATLLEVATHARLAGRSTILVDYLGCGLSDRPSSFSHTMRDHAATVAAILDHHGVGDAVIVGHSMGGTVGLFLALDRPDLVACLVLAESNLLPGGGDGTSRIAAFSEAQWVTEAAPAELLALRRAAVAGSTEAARYLAIREWASDARAVHAASVDLVGLDPSTQQRFLDLDLPRAFVYGQRTLDELAGRWTPDVPDRDLLERYGVATFAVPGSGHFMYHDNLDGYVDAIVRATWHNGVR